MFRPRMTWRTLSIVVILASASNVAVAGELLVIDNGLIRVEVDPDLFAIRYVGRPGGANFLSPLHVSERLRNEPNIDPGGIAIHGRIDGAGEWIAKGPAEIIEKSNNRIVMLAPPLPNTQIRIRLEIALTKDPREASVLVAAQTADQQSRQALLATTSLLAPAAGLRFPKTDATIRPSSGAALLTDAGDDWELATALESEIAGEAAAIDVETAGLIVHTRATAWVRRFVTSDLQRMVVRYEIDSPHRRRSLTVQAPPAEIDLWSQPTLREIWRIENTDE